LEVVTLPDQAVPMYMYVMYSYRLTID